MVPVQKKMNRQVTRVVKYNPDEDDELNDDIEETESPKQGKRVQR